MYFTITNLFKQTQLMNAKTLLLAGLGAFAYYKYKKMTPEEKEKIANSLKETGKKFAENLPEELKNVFGKKPQQV